MLSYPRFTQQWLCESHRLIANQSISLTASNILLTITPYLSRSIPLVVQIQQIFHQCQVLHSSYFCVSLRIPTSSQELPSPGLLDVSVAIWLILPNRMWLDVMCATVRMLFKNWSSFSRLSWKTFKSRP